MSISSKNLVATFSKASSGHSVNQSIVQQFTREGNILKNVNKQLKDVNNFEKLWCFASKVHLPTKKCEKNAICHHIKIAFFIKNAGKMSSLYLHLIFIKFQVWKRGTLLYLENRFFKPLKSHQKSFIQKFTFAERHPFRGAPLLNSSKWNFILPLGAVLHLVNCTFSP